MRLNLPVTNVEFLLNDGSSTVSKTDLSGTIVYVNPYFREVSGYSEEELIGQPQNVIRHPDMPPGALADMWATLRSGMPSTGRVKKRRKNIMRIYLIARAIIMIPISIVLTKRIKRRLLAFIDNARETRERMLQDALTPASFYGNGRDKSERIIDQFIARAIDQQRNEASLIRSEQRFRAFFERAPDAIFVLRRDRFVYVNAATQHLFGADSDDQLLGQSLLTQVPLDLHAAVTKQIQAVSNTKENARPVELKLFRLDGSIVYVRVSFMPLNYQYTDSSLVFARDITERKLADKALRDSEVRFRRLVALSSEWYWEHDENFVVTRIEGWRTTKSNQIPEYVIGKNALETALGDDDPTWRAHRASVEAHLPFTDFEFAWHQPDGSVSWYSVSGEPVSDEQGNYKGYRGTGKDITERKLAEEELHQSRARIRELVAHREAIKEQERKRIARDLHNELGQTLLAIRLDAVTLTEKTANSHPEHHKAARLMLSHIDQAMKSVKAVINDLRPFVLDLGLVAAMEWQISEFQRRSGIECALDVDDEDVDCQLDEHSSTALFRVLQESLTNIARHAQASHVHIMIRAEAGQLVMTIADDGIGIALNQRPKKRAFGLVGIEERIKAIGGTFAIDSAHGQGTRLFFSVPLVRVTEEAMC